MSLLNLKKRELKVVVNVDLILFIASHIYFQEKKKSYLYDILILCYSNLVNYDIKSNIYE